MRAWTDKTRICTGLLMFCLAVLPCLLQAGVDEGVSWLQARHGATGVHQSTDMARASDTNAEAYLTTYQLERAAEFSQLGAIVAGDDSDDLPAIARIALLRMHQGLSAADQLAVLLAAQGADGGFPVRPGLQSEPLTTAWTLDLLDRAGQATGTPASRAIGYLLTSQRTDGGWLPALGNASSVFVSAASAATLHRYRTRFQLDLPLQRARDFLRAQESAAHDFGDLVNTASAIDALLLLGQNADSLQAAASALAAQQQANGSFADDAYATALALRALWRHQSPVQAPDSATLLGRVLAADTDLPITGAVLQLQGPAQFSLVTNNDGRLQSANVVPGTYQASLAFAGMHTIGLELTLVSGRTLDLGDLRMTQAGGPQGNYAIIRGLVRSAETGEGIENALIAMQQPAVQVLSDADGRYQLLQVPEGDISIDVSANGYSSRSITFAVSAQTIVDFSMELTPLIEVLDGAQLVGRVLHGQTGQPLAGVSIAVVGGAPSVETFTDQNGDYQLVTEPGDLVSVMASLEGYDSVSIQVPLAYNQVLTFAPRMYPEGQTPGNANRTGITGVVINQANQRVLAHALIVVTDPGGQQVARSDAEGRFSIFGLSGPVTRLQFSMEAFDPASVLVPIQPLELRDIGRVGLKPSNVDFYLPDLVITSSSLSTTDPDSFALDTSFLVEVANRGNASLTQDFTLLAFIDANGNGVFDPEVEPEVGRVRVTDDLPVGSATTVSIAVSAQMSFRDAPVAFWVDADNEVLEDDKDNNTASSMLGCRRTPAPLTLNNVQTLWHWEGLSSNPQINSLNHTPAVVQLTDDNGDGVINQYDIPDLVFVAGRRNTVGGSTTALVAISGDDGRELWSRTDLGLSQFSSVAVGDLDNSGVADIVVVRGYRNEIIALNHDGSLKWRAPTSGPGVPPALIPPPPHVMDQPIIVNLDGDAEAEVILGRSVFRGSTGELLWNGEFDAGGFNGGKPRDGLLVAASSVAAIAADTNLNGVLEVIAGRTLYDFEGRAIWHRDDIRDDPQPDFMFPEIVYNDSGYNAVGNFDADDYPEIVLAIKNELWLLKHTGETVWGPVFSPDFSTFGVPTVIDLDDDGLPEIIIASNSRLSVFESDGTLKWSTAIEDLSGSTGVTVFDLDGDGLYEIIHMDERNLRVLDALTGFEHFRIFNSSVTAFEYPIVADINGNGQAEIVITGFDSDGGAVTPGVRALAARDGAWTRARTVWGSHAYHINDIRPDGTIPLQETPSWLTHNSYRVQESPGPHTLGMPDFTVGDLRLIDRGQGLLPVVQVRVGNAGPVDAHEPPYIGIYRGDPDHGGELLVEQRLDSLRPGRFQIVNLGEVSLQGEGELYAVVDQRGRADECRSGNNRRVIPFTATQARGDLQLVTDQLSYAPGETVAITANVNNTGSLAAGYLLQWSIRNAQGQISAELADALFALVEAGTVATQITHWSSGGVLAGGYTVYAELFDVEGRLVDVATANFAIGGQTGPLGALDVLFDQAAYQPGQAVRLSYRAHNLSASESIRLPEVIIDISGPQGYAHQRVIPFEDLFAGATRDGELAVPGALAPGEYQAQGRLRSRLSGHVYDTRHAAFERLADLGAEVQGFVSVARPSLHQGEQQTCLYSARNLGMQTIIGLPLRMSVREVASGGTMQEQLVNVDLQPGIDHVAAEPVATNALAAGDYACILERQGTDGWQWLASEGFTVLGWPTADILVEPLEGLITSESGLTAQFMVSLTRPPTSQVRIPLQPSDTSEWALSTDEVVFEVSAWSQPRQVVVFGLDDDEVDGDQHGWIHLLPAISADSAYHGIDPPDVGVTNLDNDGAEIHVAPLNIETSEDGSSDTFDVWLNTAPESDVWVSIESSDPSEWSVSPTALQFTASNWEQAQTVTVTGVDDDELDGDQLGWIFVGPAQSNDPRFDALDPADVRARNLDNNVAAIHVAPTTVVTSEAGMSGSFTVRLSAAPQAPVSVAIGPVDASEWQILDLAIELNDTNWEHGRTVFVYPVDDDVADGTQTQVLELGPAESDDPRFHGLVPEPVTLINLDDDSAQIVVEPVSGLIVHEWGSTDSFSVSLTEAPEALVTIDVESGDPSEFAVDTDQIQFSPADWAPRTVIVTGVDDELFDGNVVGQILLHVAISDDQRYDGIKPSNVLVTNIDDEVVQVLVSPEGSIETSEDGDSAEIHIRINAQPLADVVIALVNPDPSEWSLDRSEVRFTADNWEQPQIVVVTGVDDDELDGDQFGVIELLPVVSADARYNGINPRNVPIINRDNDSPLGVIHVSPLNVETSEDGSSDSFAVWLDQAPAADVWIAIESSDESEWLVSPAMLHFTPGNGAQPQIVTVTGVDDTELDGDQQGWIHVGEAQSADPRFHGINPPDVAAINRDNDIAAIQVSPTIVTTSESGQSGSFTVRLSAMPQADVIIALGPVDHSEWLITDTEVRLDASNWAQGYTVLVQGVDDDLADGDQSQLLLLGPAQSDDANFDGLPVEPVTLINLDDDQVQILVHPTSGLVVHEWGSSDSFNVALSEAPLAPVSIALSSSDPSEFAIDTELLVFTPDDWATRTVIVTGVDDDLFDGNVSGYILLHPAVSADPRYHGIDPDNVAVINIDDEQVQILVTPPEGVQTSEDGSSDQFFVQINAEPTADVLITLINPDPSEWLLDRHELRFTSANWQQPQSVLVTGVDDDELDGDQYGTIVLLPAVSDDPRYHGIDPPNVPAVNRDNDLLPEADLVIEATDLLVSEAGKTGYIDLRLSRTPSAPVRLQILSGDSSEVTVSPELLDFAPGQALEVQRVQLFGVDDDIADGDQQVEITVQVIASMDADFANLPPQTLWATNLDDDQPGILLSLLGPAQIDAGESTELRLRLSSEPLAAVTIDLQALPRPPGHADGLGLSLLPHSVTLLPSQWQQGQGVVLQSGEHASGNYWVDVSALAISSDDPLYASQNVNPVAIEVLARGAPTAPVPVPLDRTRLPLIILLLATAMLVLTRRTQGSV